ncbi:hypothetical protein V2P20_03510 [Methylobacter sp. Wu1]|jgi:hypothetical protein|uniref:hypothetical protein n=1 Tax=Methylobacter sp. Wu1 TaxID=3119359 RepID=UPI002F92F61A
MRRSPGKKPVHLQMIGGKEPRQLIWEQVRILREFTLKQLSGAVSGAIPYDTTRTYLKALHAGGILSRDEKTKVYKLEKDNGVEAPRVDRKGAEVKQGRPQENMWRTLRQLGRPVTVQELVAFASTPEHPITESYALDYLKNLFYAGYATREDGRYMLKASKNTGPRPPQIQRCKQIFDPNLGEVVWSKVNA